MSAVYHSGGMLNVLILIDTLYQHIRTHNIYSLWLMKPGAADGSIKELPPLSLCLSLKHSLTSFKTCTWLIAVIWVRKGKWEIEKWWKKIGKTALIINSVRKQKSFPLAFSFSTEVAGVGLTGAWLRRTKDITTTNEWMCLTSPDAVNGLGW